MKRGIGVAVIAVVLTMFVLPEKAEAQICASCYEREWSHTLFYSATGSRDCTMQGCHWDQYFLGSCNSHPMCNTVFEEDSEDLAVAIAADDALAVQSLFATSQGRVHMGADGKVHVRRCSGEEEVELTPDLRSKLLAIE